ncbi:phage filamentation protein Fil family protein [Citrobacter cronae]|uniref:phage filamentation protein Fil family protein n=1 Tax=Citrobacter freundii complex TaxID=1344959 RepID=UPI0018FFBC59|nr:phage filamentation protein Fil family protein [Citrobacter cronae]MBJ8413618.1 DUF2724 domain-containing protein [Citrobacter cronae]DAE71438.1 MAG TPA: Protein of unknown function (DUF2724) [Caudoviricetes sp.]HAZ4262975.1 DUF2724 domain-containing protein [Escherichia coli]HEI8931179.1 DUF2724 domain-containing protein [Citrobacter freundii]
MLKREPSFASLLVKQSPSMHFGHGWIVGGDGKRWHPCNSQSELLNGLSTNKRRTLWPLKVLRQLFH